MIDPQRVSHAKGAPAACPSPSPSHSGPDKYNGCVSFAQVLDRAKCSGDKTGRAPEMPPQPGPSGTCGKGGPHGGRALFEPRGGHCPTVFDKFHGNKTGRAHQDQPTPAPGSTGNCDKPGPHGGHALFGPRPLLFATWHGNGFDISRPFNVGHPMAMANRFDPQRGEVVVGIYVFRKMETGVEYWSDYDKMWMALKTRAAKLGDEYWVPHSGGWKPLSSLLEQINEALRGSRANNHPMVAQKDAPAGAAAEAPDEAPEEADAAPEAPNEEPGETPREAPGCAPRDGPKPRGLARPGPTSVAV
jgi:hypothetical protein